MRSLLLSLMLLPAVASADRAITVPTGYVLRPGEFRFEHVVGAGIQPSSFGQVGVVEFVELQFAREGAGNSIGLLYSVMQPFADFFPGVSVGVLDILGETPRGRTFFAAFTFQQFIDSDWATDEFAALTIGIGSPRFRGAFVALVLPMLPGVTLIGEHDSRAMTVGLQFEPMPHVAIRAMVRENKPLVGLQIYRKF